MLKYILAIMLISSPLYAAEKVVINKSRTVTGYNLEEIKIMLGKGILKQYCHLGEIIYLVPISSPNDKGEVDATLRTGNFYAINEDCK